MPISIDAPSAAVNRTLQTLVEHAGAIAGDYRLQHHDGRITIGRGDKLLHELSCPVRVQTLAKLLSGLGQTAELPALPHGWEFDAAARQLGRQGDNHALTEKESLLLAALLGAYPQSRTREALLKDVWGIGTDVETHTLETHVYRLRNKLAALSPRPCDIITSGSAYQLTMEAA